MTDIEVKPRRVAEAHGRRGWAGLVIGLGVSQPGFAQQASAPSQHISLPPPAGARQKAERDQADWANFRGRWVQRDGRVTDSGNRNVSHSEGQGTGLIFAARHHDRIGSSPGPRARCDGPAMRCMPGATHPARPCRWMIRTMPATVTC